MKITVITGTAYDGCTHRVRDLFLSHFPEATILSFVLPDDGPDFCTGCKTCFKVDETKCPHASKVLPIWQAMKEADLLVVVYPVYVMRAPAQVKALLDHLAVHWFAHRPVIKMFDKRAVILTQSSVASNKAAQKDVKTCLNWLGVSFVKSLGLRLVESTDWEAISAELKAKLALTIECFASSLTFRGKPAMSLRVRLYFALTRLMQRRLKKKAIDSVDNRYWRAQGWI